MFTDIKFAACGVILLVLIGVVWRYDYIVKKLDKQTIELAQVQVNNAALEKQATAANVERAGYLKQIEDSKNETDSIRNNVNNGTTILRVKANCPMSKTSTDTARIITASPELTEDARQDYYSLRQGITEVTARLELCINTLKDERK